jgi:hypothetical protein
MSTNSVETAVYPQSSDYRDIDIREGFDWPQIINKLARRNGKLLSCVQYLVVFRSERADGVDPEHIANLDLAAHDEAATSSALLHYFAGDVDEQGKALSWCLWTDRLAAFQAMHGAAHQQAVKQACELYGDNYAIELYSVNLEENESVSFLQHSHPKSKNIEQGVNYAKV